MRVHTTAGIVRRGHDRHRQKARRTPGRLRLTRRARRAPGTSSLKPRTPAPQRRQRQAVLLAVLRNRQPARSASTFVLLPERARMTQRLLTRSPVDPPSRRRRLGRRRLDYLGCFSHRCASSLRSSCEGSSKRWRRDRTGTFGQLRPACRYSYNPRTHRKAQRARSLRVLEGRARAVADIAGQSDRRPTAVSMAASRCIELTSLVRHDVAIGVNTPSPHAHSRSTSSSTDRYAQAGPRGTFGGREYQRGH